MPVLARLARSGRPGLFSPNRHAGFHQREEKNTRISAQAHFGWSLKVKDRTFFEKPKAKIMPSTAIVVDHDV
jgi:hypothetical protein